jgi:hypothetical protein
MFMRVSYGSNINFTTASSKVQPNIRSTWPDEKQIDLNMNYLQLFEKMTIDINMLNSQGFIRISLMAAGVTSSEEFYRLDLPVLNIFDCACGKVYDGYFPLLSREDIYFSDGDWGNYSAKVYSEEKFQRPPEAFFKPYIRLYLKAETFRSHDCIPVERQKDTGVQSLFSRTKVPVENEVYDQTKEEITRRWGRISFPCVSVSLVNSSKKLEVSNDLFTTLERSYFNNNILFNI